MKLKFEYTRGGTMGGHYRIQLEDGDQTKDLGHLYIDADDEVNVEQLLIELSSVSLNTEFDRG